MVTTCGDPAGGEMAMGQVVVSVVGQCGGHQESGTLVVAARGRDRSSHGTRRRSW